MKHKKPLIDGLPQDFVLRIQEQFPEQASDILKSFQQRPPILRVNTLIVSTPELQTRLSQHHIETEPLEQLPDVLLASDADRKQLTETPEWQEGLFYIQSIASLLTVKALDPQPGETVLDLCAAPGSKTSQIVLAMKKKGEIMANDNNQKRIFRLKANLEQQHMDGVVEIKNYPGQNYAKFYPAHFDRILVDAPCSSESRFDPRYPKSINYWSRHKVKAMAKKQRKLLSSAIDCLKPGGVLVYSTCTLSPQENEQVVDWNLKKHPEVTVEAIDWDGAQLPIHEEWNDKSISKEVQNAIRLYPNEMVEPFFICRMRKKP